MSNLPIRIENVSVVFRGRNVLEDINLEVNEHDFIGLIGPNGAGKTVLLKTLLGIVEPTSGSIAIFGEAPPGPRGAIGYVPQFAGFETQMPISVFDVVLTGRLAAGNLKFRYSAEDRRIAKSCLEAVDLLDLRDSQVGKLSGGQIQRVLIARALAVQPKILLLDEPTASLDSPSGQTVYSLLEKLAASLTIILVSHDIGVLSTYVKTVACLNQRLHYHGGRELPAGLAEEVYGCPVELIAHGHAHRVFDSHTHDASCQHSSGKKEDKS